MNILSRLALSLLTFSTLVLVSPMACAQGTTDYVPGKVYLIRLSPFLADADSTRMVHFPRITSRLEETGAMVEFVSKNLYLMRTLEGDSAFIGYFHADRQSHDELTRDFNLLTWLFHGHDVRIMPIELAGSNAVHLPIVEARIQTSTDER